MSPKAHEHVVPWRRALAQVPKAANTVLVAQGQYAPEPDRSVRVGVLGDESAKTRVLADIWLHPDDIPFLCASLAVGRSVRRGHWDVMYATPWEFAWTDDDDGPFEVWHASGTWASVAQGWLSTHAGERCLSEEVTNVDAYLSDGWIRRGVRAQLVSERAIVIAEKEDDISLIDPTYDGINILFEAAWAVGLAQALARSLGVSVSKHEAL